MNSGESLQWICVRTRQKRERIAAAHLGRLAGIEVFGPTMRYRKMTRRGSIWFREPLFPSYLFVRLNLQQHQRDVAIAEGVAAIVRFGMMPATIPDQAMSDLKQLIPEQELLIPAPQLTPGVQVVLSDPLFLGMRAIVTQVIPGRERVKVLLDFLGSTSVIETRISNVLVETDHFLAA